VCVRVFVCVCVGACACACACVRCAVCGVYVGEREGRAGAVICACT
jgi:hypothetical protein